jgi:hypothetical protein
MNRKEIQRRKKKNDAARAERAQAAILRGDPVGKGGRQAYLNATEQEELVRLIREWEDPVLQPSAEEIPPLVSFTVLNLLVLLFFGYEVGSDFMMSDCEQVMLNCLNILFSLKVFDRSWSFFFGYDIHIFFHLPHVDISRKCTQHLLWKSF